MSDRLKSNLKREFSRSLLAKLGLVLLAIILIMGTFAPILATHDPTRTGYKNDQGDSYPPMFTSYEDRTLPENGSLGEPYVIEHNSSHILGTNNIGQDVYSRLLYGARTSLLVAVFGTLLALFIGVPYGLLSGYYGGRVDDTLMRGADIMLAFPSLVLAIALVGVFGERSFKIPDPFVAAGITPGMPENIVIPGTVTIVSALVIWVWFARVARGEALSIRDEEYVKAAKSVGASDSTILLRHVLPNSLTPIIVLATIQIAVIILLESSLSFLGFSGTQLSWGFEIQRGQNHLASQWWVSTIPGIGILLAVVSINLLGDWLRDSLDPNIGGEGGA
jgi:peptide/nickel transport system permease protein